MKVLLAVLLSRRPPAACRPPTGRSGGARPATGSSPASRPGAAWPEALTAAWKVAGRHRPLLAGGGGRPRVYVFSREGEEEVLQALDLATGKRVWRQAYPAPYTLNSAAASHGKGPKATPVVADGRVFTLGISGILSRFDAARGRLLWRKEFSEQFQADLADLRGGDVAAGGRAACVIAHVGGDGDGALTAFDAATGAVRWAWKGDGPGYASPVVGGARRRAPGRHAAANSWGSPRTGASCSGRSRSRPSTRRTR